MTGKHSIWFVALILAAFPYCVLAQGGLCSQRMADGKYYQVPCTYQNPQPPNQPPATQPTPSGPTQQQLDQQAADREKERLRKEKERKQQEAALKAAEEAAKQAEFIRKRDEATTELKGLDADTTPKLKDLPDTTPCTPSKDASVVDLCSNAGKVSEPLFKPPPDDTVNPTDLKAIKQIVALADKRNWTPDERNRLIRQLYSLGTDGDPDAGTAEITQTWKAITTRAITASLLRDIRTAKGVTLSAAGRQTSFNDCAVFALATATGRPYGVIAAMATKTISEGEWRPDADRKNPQQAIERKGGGLNVGEIVLLAETLGKADVVGSGDFAKTIRSGKPVIIGITFSNHGGHEVVLSKTFERAGETWFEMIDSNQGPFRKLYLSQKELKTLLLDKGITYSPDPGTTPKLLR